jgi:zinc-ribbon domain
MPSCANCGSETPADARFCPRCGAPLREGAAETPEAPPAFVFPAAGWELCEILWWRGYVMSEFYAVAEGQELARSRRFRWRGDRPPAHDHAAARAAHEALVGRLTEAGWEPLGQAIPWYAQRFRRQSTGLRLLAMEPGKAAEEDSADG